MKRMLIALTVLLGIGLLASDASQIEDKTVDLYFQITYTTPYGVQKKNESGRPLVDKNGNPVVVFVMKRTTEHSILRVETKNGVTNAYWLSVGKNGNIERNIYKRRQAFVTLPMASSERYYNRPNDNGRHGALVFEYIVDRGLGLSPVKCTVAGHFKYGTPEKPIDGTMFSGELVGFGEDDSQALGIKETTQEQVQEETQEQVQEEAPKTRSESTQKPKCTCTCSEDCPCRAVCIAYHNQQNPPVNPEPEPEPEPEPTPEPEPEVVGDDTPTVPLPKGIVRLPVYGSFNATYNNRKGSDTYIKSILTDEGRTNTIQK